MTWLGVCSTEDDGACLLIFGPESDGGPRAQARLASLLPVMAYGKFLVSRVSCC